MTYSRAMKMEELLLELAKARGLEALFVAYKMGELKD